MTAIFPYMPPRWTTLRPHQEQQKYFGSPHRFNIVPSGRRSGKTELAKRKLVKCALAGTKFADPRFFAAAPTYQQAKRIYWNDLKRLVPKWAMRGTPSESELVIKLINGAELYVIGMDKPERIEGQPWDGGVLDEKANMKPEAWGANVRPALSDRKGWCDLIGVPEGRNDYYDMALTAQAQMASEGKASQWGYFHWMSADILDAAEIESARNDLDPLTFAQEYEGSFINFEGRAYYVFDSSKHVAPLAYNDRNTIAFCFDFNVDPGVAAICQEQVLPGQYHRDTAGMMMLDRPITGTGVIGEVYIERNSNTPAVCRKLIEDWGKHQGRVVCYGDATGGSRGSAKVQGSDWDLIKANLNPHFGSRIEYRVPSANPSERSRVNSVNTRLMASSGDVRLMVDGKAAPRVVKDLDGVVLLKGGSGELDKKATPALTHISDALGYYVVKEFPVVPQILHHLEMQGI
jgi:hypothetical protein